jgi:hypothetical protein
LEGANANIADLFGKMGNLMRSGGKRPTEKKKLPVKEALPIMLEVEVRRPPY